MGYIITDILEKFKSRCKRLDVELVGDGYMVHRERVYDGLGDLLDYDDAVSLLNDILVEVLDD